MAIQTSDTVANDGLNAIETTVGASPSLLIFSGAVPANCAAADPAGTLATLTLPSDWLAAAGSRAKALAGTWSGTASGGAATAPASWRIKVGATCHMQGTAGVGSGDMSFNGSITTGQTITVTTFGLTDGNP
jgi:hypothetical protein